MGAKKIITFIIILLMILGLFYGAYYISKDRVDSKDNFVTGNIIYESVEPSVIDPIEVENKFGNSLN